MPLGKLLHRVRQEHRTGVIRLRRNKLVKLIYFQNGHPVWADSNVRREVLGEALVEAGIVTNEVIDQALKAGRETGRKLGEILISTGAISPHRLLEALTQHVETRILNSFEWPDASFDFQALDEIPPDVVPVRLDTVRLVIQGALQCKDKLGTRPELANLGMRKCVPNPKPQYTQTRTGLVPDDQRIMDLALSGKTVREILDRAGTEEKVERILFALLCLEMIRLEDAPRAGPITQPRTVPTTPPKSAPTRPPSVASEALPKTRPPGVAFGASPKPSTQRPSVTLDGLPKTRPPGAASVSVPKSRLSDSASALAGAPCMPSEPPRSQVGVPAGKDSVLPGASSKGGHAEDAYRTGKRYFEEGEYGLAAKSFAVAVQKNPLDPRAKMYLGWSQFISSPETNYEQARESILAAISLKPDYAVAYYYLGCMKKTRGEEEDAMRCFRQALEYDPELSYARSELMSLESRRRQESSKPGSMISRLMGKKTGF